MMKNLLNRVRARSSEGREDGIGSARVDTGRTRGSGEDGAILILAFVYLVAVGLVITMLSTWVTNDLNNSTHFTSANSTTLAATDMTEVAIQYVRYHPLISSSQPVGVASPTVACWGGDSITAIPVINGVQVAVWCSTQWNPLSYVTREVTFDACPINVSATSCQGNNALLEVDVRFDDYPPAPARSAPIQDLCSVWCGSGMTIVSWEWGSSTTGSITGVAASMTFSNEPSDTSAGASTQASVTVLDSSGNPVAGDTVSLVQQSGPSAGISAPTSTLTAVTNTAGVAVFTSIVPQFSGNYTVTAADGTATATSTNFVVSTRKSVISVTSTAPTNATVGGAKYNPVTATATTGDAVAITSATPTVCTIAANVATFVGVGTCTLDFNDPATGNPNYSAAVQVRQSFPVGGLAATKVAIALSTTTPTASATTNTTVTLTLENAVGATVNSSGTTTVVLSDIGSGVFSASNGAAGAASLDVSFANGTSSATAYFGDQNTGPDTLSAVNGTTNWGSASLTVGGGVASQVAITPSTTTPGVSSTTTTTLTLQLEDQWGNPATSSGTTTLALSDSDNGFFANSNGASGTSTLNVTFASGAGTATVYFGDKTAGSDVITAKNGASVWATSALSLVAGSATTAQVTLSPTAPPRSNSTNATVTIQLLDQFGNHVSTAGVSLTMSNSANGFFATKSGISVGGGATSTLTLTTNAAGVATGYFGDNVVQSVTVTATASAFAVTTPPFIV